MSATNIIPFAADKLPAHLRRFKADNAALGQVLGGFPVISLKGKRFTVIKEGARKIITDPRTDEPAQSIVVAIMKANAGLSKAYYAKEYAEGADAKPDCFSNDGLRPSPASPEMQAKTCAACPHNIFGSSNTGRGKACPDTKRLAVAAPNNLDEPMLLRVPPSSLKTLAQYGKRLDAHGADVRFVATKIGFDPEVTHQALTFTPVGYLDEATVEQIMSMQDSDVLLNITGELAQPKEEEPEPAPVKPKLEAVPTPVEEPEPAPKPAPVAAAPKATTPKVKVKQDIPAEPAEELEDSISAFLSGGFDD